ncbi:hypothetical protein WJX84_007168 [Apatococcus fuscideae]|uniref:Amine oxidase domain-containing protein n=1 Tax=Apatococcus fuscideae TaxID=2026836 RepID=A0AAW1STL9_9CHLO
MDLMSSAREECPFHGVVVVGAGLAGLSAASHLAQSCPDLLLLEASERIGGRVHCLEGVLPWPVEAGCSFVHGQGQTLERLLHQTDCRLVEHAWPDRFFLPHQRKLVTAAEKDEELDKVHQLFMDVGGMDYPAVDISARQWLEGQGASPAMLDIAEACYANDFGCSLDQLGLTEMITESRRWDAGDSYFTLDRPMMALAESLAQRLPDSILCRWPLARVDHGPEGALLYGPSGLRIRCRHLILAVPHAILKAGSIHFSPPLPAAKLAAMGRVKVSNAIKVILAFSQPFWPEDFFDVVCPGGFMHEYWVSKPPPSMQPSASQPPPEDHDKSDWFQPPTPSLHQSPSGTSSHRSTAPSSSPPDASASEEMSGMRGSAIIRAALAQLDQIFATKKQARPASRAYERGHVVDWSREPYARGAYTYPSLGAHVNDRNLLAEPLGQTVFFAGEATHPAINPCIQAAIETGQRAAAQVSAALLSSQNSKL